LVQKFLRCVKIVLAITTLINNCFEQGIFPDRLKIASVNPLYKVGDINDYHNYCPISILPTLSKVFEKNKVSLVSKFYFRQRRRSMTHVGNIFTYKSKVQHLTLTKINN